MKKQTHKDQQEATKSPTLDPAQAEAAAHQNGSAQNGPEAMVDEAGTGAETEKEKEIKGLKDELAVKNDAFIRLTAEYQNYRRRVEKEKQDLIKYGNEKLVLDLLKVLDNFDRALSAVDYECEENKNLVSGIEMIRRSLSELLKSYGVDEIASVDQPFDPQLHHAVMTEVVEGMAPDTVIEEFQKGYTLNQKVIRPSMVKVSAH